MIFILGIISITMIGSTEFDGTFHVTRDIIVQGGCYILGFILIIALLRINYQSFLGLEKYMYIAAIVLLFSVYVPGLGIEQFGSRAWINLGITTLQPSEFVKLLFILIMASYFESHRNELHSFRGLIKSAIVAAPIIVIVLKEDLGSALVFAAIWLAMLFFAGIDYGVLGKFMLLVLAAIPVAYRFLADYQKERIEAFLHPSNLSLAGNYQVFESKIAIGSGGFFGKGLFHGLQKELDFIPVAKSDFIFSVICEELGFLGGLLVILLFAFLLYRLTRVIKETSTMYGALIVVGVIGMFLFQAFENIAMTMGIMPVTGITLPFMSLGGSSILSNMLAIAMVVNVSYHSNNINFKQSSAILYK
ncbi:MAG: FtsW/RodA/SpoVE family cell cycle protein [Clostridia bacterium]|nr:FtsW/RodA/SpoVE family cell cycle protein [Clostridia bacterium]